jgi:hypothetical protein
MRKRLFDEYFEGTRALPCYILKLQVFYTRAYSDHIGGVPLLHGSLLTIPLA